MIKLAAFLLAAALAVMAAGPQTFTGVITCTMCGKDHSSMGITPDSKCVLECIKHGSKFALYDGKNVYVLSDQKSPEKFAAQKVKITGTFYAATRIIKVDSIVAAR